jgi:exosortase
LRCGIVDTTLSLRIFVAVAVVVRPETSEKMAVATRNLQRWTRWHAVAALLFAAMGAIVVSSALADIYEKAIKDEENSHILLVPLVAAWMIWVRWSRVRYCRPSWTLLGPIIIAIGWASWSYGYWQNRDTFFHFGAIVVVIGCVVSVLGRHVLMRFAPAVMLLVFLIPVPTHIRQKIAIPMQIFTAQVTQTKLEVVGVNEQRDGSQLTVNNHPVNIVEACNGMRMVFPLILVGYAFAFGMPLKQWVRALLLLLSPFAAILCNVIRILPTVLIYGYGSREMGDTFHTFSGWAMLPISFLLLLGIVRLLRWAMIPVMRYTLVAQ